MKDGGGGDSHDLIISSNISKLSLNTYEWYSKYLTWNPPASQNTTYTSKNPQFTWEINQPSNWFSESFLISNKLYG